MWLQRRGATTHSFIEAPVFDAAGRLYIVDIPNGRIFRISPDGDFEIVVEYDGYPNGLAASPDGRIFIADQKNGLLALDPASGTLETLIAHPPGDVFKGLNDLIFDRAGNLYFTDQGETGLHDPTGRLWKRTITGELFSLLDNVPSPNGLVLTPDESILYLAVTRDNAVWRVPLHLDGRVGRVGRFIQLSGGLGGPDGMAISASGSLVVCQIGMGAVWLFDRLGQPKLRINTLGLLPTNVTFAKDDPRTIFITEAEHGVVMRYVLAEG
ncbi:SMP-30/gluconolactonase/LRE family protein [Shinella sp.]|uniref:SMP-30/gluconolactonase/LRE family protein n=1 Tax=Shinella sp. TaxID=1870904 RepID=UPI003F6FE1C6